jgi:D-lactate dehydrogenase (cytochrome)
MEICTDPAIIAGYLTDASNLSGHAQALLRPRDVSQVAEIVSHCQRETIPLTVTAKRTSTTGASVPLGGWLLSTEYLTARCDIGIEHATVSAGWLLGAFQSRVEQAGRCFPPDPTSRWDCSIGGAIACNASGARSFHYGATRPWVESVEVVLPTGEVRRADRSTPLPDGWPDARWPMPRVKHAAGYFPGDNLLDLLIGAEGTLGVVTEATVRLTDPVGPLLGLMFFFENVEQVARAVDEMRAEKQQGSVDIAPLCIEYFDRFCLELIRDRVGGIPAHAHGALYIEHPFLDEAPLEVWAERIGAWTPSSHATLVALDAPSRQRIHAARHAVPAAINEKMARLGFHKIATDCAVPDAALRQMLADYDGQALPHATFGHIGDNHLHCNFLPRSEAERSRAEAAALALTQQAVDLGGTVSAEHGIGKLKHRALRLLLDESSLERLAALKAAADPAWILGRDNVLDAP